MRMQARPSGWFVAGDGHTMHSHARGIVVSWVLPLALLLAVAGLTVLSSGGLVFAAHPYDEALYQGYSAGLWHGVLPASDYSPGYDFFYALFNTPGTSPAVAYQGVRLCVTVLLVVLAFGALRRHLDWPVATLCGLIVAASASATTVMTLYVAGAAILAGALWLVGPTPRRAGLALCLLSIGVSIRPEYALVVLAATVMLWPVLAQRKRWYLPAVVALCAVAAYTLLVPQYDRDVRHYPGGRLSFAFCQHYAWNQYDRGTSIVRGYHLHDKMDHCELVLAHDFGAAAHTLPAFVRANPRAFASHVAYNLAIAPVQLAAALSVQVGMGAKVPGVVLGAVWLALAFVTLYARFRRRRLRPRLRRGRPFALSPWVGVALSTLVLYAPWLVIRPRFDYQVELLPVFVLTLGLMIDALRRRPSTSPPR